MTNFSRTAWGIAATALLLGCAPPRMPDAYRRAVKLEAEGDDLGALAAFEKAAQTCEGPPADCDLCKLRLGETYERLGRFPAAKRTWSDLQKTSKNPATAARALDLCAELVLRRLNQPKRAVALSIQVIERYPDETAAADALRRICRRYRADQREPQLFSLLQQLHGRVPPTSTIAANLLFVAARGYKARGQHEQAVKLYDRLAAAGPKSPLWDDALFEAAALQENLNRPKEALSRLRALLKSRKKALLMGSYNSVHLDDAKLQAARIQAEKLNRPDQALTTLAELPKHFPTSRLRDEALLLAARIQTKQGQKQKACATLADLQKQFGEGTAAPQGKDLAKKLGCPKKIRQ